MNTYETAIADIFQRGVSRGKLDLAEERAAIAAAKLGDEEATLKLMYAYAYQLRESIAQYRWAGGIWADGPRDPNRAEELRMAAVEAFLEALYAFDLSGAHDRLAATLGGYLKDGIGTSVVAPIAVTVPERTLKRFYGILRKAEGNEYKAAALAPQYEMTTETFLAVLSAVRSSSLDAVTASADDEGGSPLLDSALPVWDSGQSDVEDRLLVEAAFRAVDELETLVVSDYYGFSEYNTKSDAEIAGERGLSRPKVQRVRSSALGKMRNALGVA